MADVSLTGGCLCGAVRYTIQGPAVDTHHCHCGICRKFSGALFVTVSYFPKDRVTLTQGTDNLSTYDTSKNVHRRFCKTCGSPVIFEIEGEDVVVLPTGSIDDGANPGHPPETVRHTFVKYKVPWYEITDNLPQQAEGTAYE